MKQQPNYGYPFSSIILRMLIGILIILSIIALFFLDNSWYFTVLICLIILPAYVLFGIIIFKKRFYDYRMHIQKKMIKLLNLKGDEIVLDLGAGAGPLVIAFAKFLKDGKAYGLDRYSFNKEEIGSKIIKFVRINYLGHTLKNAKRNAENENVDKKCEFVSGDFTRHLNFPDGYFDIISSFQSLHIIPAQKQIQAFREIDRLLKREGRIIFFEPSHYLEWDINKIKNYFINIGYDVDITQLKTRVILLGKKLSTDISV